MQYLAVFATFFKEAGAKAGTEILETDLYAKMLPINLPITHVFWYSYNPSFPAPL